MLESLDMQDFTGGISLPNHKERPTVKTVRGHHKRNKSGRTDLNWISD